jgi:hypothetical protein
VAYKAPMSKRKKRGINSQDKPRTQEYLLSFPRITADISRFVPSGNPSIHHYAPLVEKTAQSFTIMYKYT